MMDSRAFSSSLSLSEGPEADVPTGFDPCRVWLLKVPQRADGGFDRIIQTHFQKISMFCKSRMMNHFPHVGNKQGRVFQGQKQQE
jgi:hypothetical protein